MSRALVIGGSGFLGSHVADALTEQGYEVFIYDIRQSPYLRSDQKFIQASILDKNVLSQSIKSMDFVYNFSAISDIDEADHDAYSTAEINIMGNINVLDACNEAGVKKIIFASSIYVYSEYGSFYRISKQTSERLVEEYQRRYGLDYVILRYGSLYGRRSDMRNGIYSYLYQALANDGCIKYSGSEDAVREYIHVLDAAKLSVQALHDEYSNRSLVLTGHEKYQIKTLMSMIKEIMPHDIRIEYGNNRCTTHYNVTPYKFQPALGHKLVTNDYIDMGQGLLDTIDEIYSQQKKNCVEVCES
jgi:UDP-glucose 4-epimerase